MPGPDDALPLEVDAGDPYATGGGDRQELIASARLKVGGTDMAVGQLGKGEPDVLNLRERVVPYCGVRVVERDPVLVGGRDAMQAGGDWPAVARELVRGVGHVSSYESRAPH